MLKSFSIGLLAAALCLAGCSPKAPGEGPAAGTLASNGFENVDGWLADSPALTTLNRDKAHSGMYSTMVGPGHDYSLGYSNALSRLSPDWPAKLKIGVWVFVPSDQAAAKLVTEVKAPTNDGPGLLWDGLDVSKTVKVYNKWQYVEKTLVMPAGAKPTNRLLVYLWRADSRQPVYLDDLTISAARE